MLARSQLGSLSSAGDTHMGLLENISTSALQTVRVGEGAGKISSGEGNVFVGYETGKQALSTNYTTAVGYQAMCSSANSVSGTAVGAFAAAQNTGGNETVYVGFRCGELAKNGNQVTAVGAYAMHENSAANASTAVGYRAAERTLDGGYCVFIGALCGQDNRTSTYTTMAGYQAGRASRGDANCYFGAFSGYSNYQGNNSCLFGFRAGESTSGDFNSAFGAYAMRNASGSSNVAIGAFANSSGISSTESVFIGTNVASSGNASQSVILGANAGSVAHGTSMVIIGYNSAQNLIWGNCNIMIGTGAGTYTSSNNNGIAIGSLNTITFNNSISVGNLITNSKERSVLVGYKLTCDADKSVVLGSTINIQSLQVFQDPLAAPFVNFVVNDAQQKLGVNAIEYTTTLVNPVSGNAYTVCQASIVASNTINSISHPSGTYNVTSRNSFTLYNAPFVQNNGYAIVHGVVNPLRKLSDLSGTVNVPVTPAFANVKAIRLTYNGTSFQVLANGTVLNPIWTPTTLSTMMLVDSVDSEYLFDERHVTVNIIQFGKSNVSYNTYFPKRLAKPVTIPSTYTSTELYSPLQFVASSKPAITSYTSSLTISYNDNDGINLSDNANMYNATTSSIWRLSEEPRYGYVIESGGSYSYTPYIESAFASSDSFYVTPVLEVAATGASQKYGIPAAENVKFNIKFDASNEMYSANTMIATSNLVANSYAILYLNSNHIQGVPSIPQTHTVKITSIDSNISVSRLVNGTTYNYNYSNINQLSFTYNDVIQNKISLTVNSNIGSRALSNTVLRINNTCNLVIPIRTAVNPFYIALGTNNNVFTGFTCNIHTACNELYQQTLPIPFLTESQHANVYDEGISKWGALKIPQREYSANDFDIFPVYQSINPWQTNDVVSLIMVDTQTPMLTTQTEYNFAYDNSTRISSTPLYVRNNLGNITYDITRNVTSKDTYSFVPQVSNLDITRTYSNQSYGSTARGYISTTSNYYGDGKYNSNNGYILKTHDIYILNTSNHIADVPDNQGTFTFTSNVYSSYTITSNVVNIYGLVLSTSTATLSQSFGPFSYPWKSNIPYMNITSTSNKQMSYVRSVSNIVVEQHNYLYSCNVQHISRINTSNTYYNSLSINEFLYSSNYSMTNAVTEGNTVTYSTPRDVSITYTTSNILLTSNITNYIPVSLLTRNHVWNNTPNCQFSNMTTNVITIKKKVGHITSWTLDDVLCNIVYVRANENVDSMELIVSSPTWYVDESVSLGVEAMSTSMTNAVRTVSSNSIEIDSVSHTCPLIGIVSSLALLVSDFTPYNLHLYNIRNGTIVSKNKQTGMMTLVTTIPNVLNSDDIDVLYVATSRYSSDKLELFFSDSTYTQASQLFEINLKVNQYPSASGQNFNRGVSIHDTSKLRPETFYHSINNIENCNLLIKNLVLPQGLNIRKVDNTSTNFTIQDIVNSNVQVYANTNINGGSISYELYDTTLNVSKLIGTYTFPINVYFHNRFPIAASSDSTIRMMSVSKLNPLTDCYYNQLIGSFWKNIENLNVQGTLVDKQDIQLAVTSVNKGILFINNNSNHIQTTIQYSDMCSNLLRYIPFNPDINAMYNDTIQFQLVYKYDTITPMYSMDMQIYLSRFSPSTYINTLASYVRPPIQSPSIPIRSWSSPCNITDVVNTGVGLWKWIEPTIDAVTVPVIQYTFSIPVHIDTSSEVSFELDQADSISIENVLSRVSWDINRTYDLHEIYMYVVTPPEFGIVQRASTGESVARCAQYELHNGDIVYQHFGTSQTTDTMKVAFSTTPYDLTSNELSVRFNIKPLPVIQANLDSFMFYDTSNQVKNIPYNVSSCNIVTSIDKFNYAGTPYSSYIHILNASNVTFLSDVKQITANGCNVCTFNIGPDVIEHVNYPTMGFDFLLNNTQSINKLAFYDLYKPLFVSHHTAYLNRYIDSNNIQYVPGSDDLYITYSFASNVSTLLGMGGHTVSMSFDVLPYNWSINNKCSNILQSRFQFNLGFYNSDRIDITFTLSSFSLSYKYNNTPNHIDGVLPTYLNESDWNNIQLVNLDPKNNHNLSLYLDNGANLLSSYNIPHFDSSQLSNVSIKVNPTDPNNYIASSNFTRTVVPNQDSHDNGYLHVSYDLYNTYSLFKFRNVQFNVTTYPVDADANTSTNAVNNLILGNEIIVNGTNNICIGNSFKTSGSTSIIIGNDNGKSSFGTGDIYESIIIGNSSFQNSAVRGVISIGRNNLNDLSLSDTRLVQNFLGQNPVVIGNNISKDMIDYYINIQNTFMKTINNTASNNNGPTQIYLGHEREVVGIGYSTNANLPSDYLLNVSGGITASYINAQHTILAALSPSFQLSPSSYATGYIYSATGSVKGTMPYVTLSGATANDKKIIGVSVGKTTDGNMLLGVAGCVYVWCKGAVACGQFLQASTSIPGVASPSAVNIITKTNYTFSKSLMDWNGTASDVTVTTKYIGSTLCGLILCLI